jgi:hypothetical protein
MNIKEGFNRIFKILSIFITTCYFFYIIHLHNAKNIGGISIEFLFISSIILFGVSFFTLKITLNAIIWITEGFLAKKELKKEEKEFLIIQQFKRTFDKKYPPKGN